MTEAKMEPLKNLHEKAPTTENRILKLYNKIRGYHITIYGSDSPDKGH